MGRSFVCRETLDFGGTWSGVSCAGNPVAVCGSGSLGAEGGEAFDGQNLLVEDEAELAGCLVGDGFETWQSSVAADCAASRQFRFRLVTGRSVMPQGIDEAEVAQIGGDVEGESVGGDAAGDVDADGADLAFAARVVFVHGSAAVVRRAAGRRAPDAGETADAAGTDAEDAAETDEGLFHEADEVDRAEAAAVGVAEAAQIEDGVADELAGAVIGDVAAAVDLVEGDAAAGQQFVGGEDVGAVGVAAEGEHRRMLEQQQDVVDAALEAQLDELRLEAKSLVVGNAAEIEVLNHRCFDCNETTGRR